jgi:hypothetical protein
MVDRSECSLGVAMGASGAKAWSDRAYASRASLSILNSCFFLVAANWNQKSGNWASSMTFSRFNKESNNYPNFAEGIVGASLSNSRASLLFRSSAVCVVTAVANCIIAASKPCPTAFHPERRWFSRGNLWLIRSSSTKGAVMAMVLAGGPCWFWSDACSDTLNQFIIGLVMSRTLSADKAADRIA